MSSILTTRLLTRPAGAHQAIRFNQALHHIYQLALLLHALFFVLFAVLEIGFLTLFNTVSIGIYLLALVLNHSRHWQKALLLVYLEVILHAVVATVLIGWDSGFQLYLFVVGPVILLNPLYSLFTRLGLTLVPILIKAGLYIYLEGQSAWLPLFSLPDELLRILYVSNMFAVYFTIGFIAFTFGAIAKRAEGQLMAATAEWERKAHLDMLTEIYNRRAMDDLLRKEVSRCARDHYPFAVALADIDDFKNINDNYGHNVGDEVIRQVAQCIQSNIRKHDAVGRWGGEEFLLLLTNADDKVTPGILENIRHQVLITSEQTCGIPSHTVTIGYAIFYPGDTIESVLKSADDALYHGKRAGKNTLVHINETPNSQQAVADTYPIA